MNATLNILVSGGYGYVGRFIVDYFARLGHNVSVGSRNKTDIFNDLDIIYRPLTLNPEQDQSNAFENIDIFIHCAFDHIKGRYRGGEGDDPKGFIQKNLDGSIALFEQAKNASVKYCIFLSSRAVYGTQKAGAELFEDMECYPDTLYGQVKLDAENALLKLKDNNFHPIILRATGIFGIPFFRRDDLEFGKLSLEQYLQNQIRYMLDNPDQWHKWQDLFTDHMNGKPIEPRAGTEIHGTELAMAIEKLLFAKPNPIGGEIFNLSHMLLDRHDLFKAFNKSTGSAANLPARSNTANYNIMNIDKFQKCQQ